MPRAPKPRNIRQNTERRDVGDVPADVGPLIDAIDVPRAPVGLLASTRASWDRYFRSPARHVTVQSLDLDLLERLWTLYDERERTRQELRRPIRDAEGKILRRDSRMIEGSKGQLRPNGLYNVISRLDGEIRQLEDRVAKSMKSRLTLGMVVGGDDPRADEPDEPRDPTADPVDDGPGPDPRLYVLDGGAG
jgi:hypothetical protein